MSQALTGLAFFHPHKEFFMPKVLCTLPNASAEIGGVKFESVDGGMMSEEVSDDQAEYFSAIPGYAVVGAKAPVKTATPTTEKPAAKTGGKKAATAPAPAPATAPATDAGTDGATGGDGGSGADSGAAASDAGGADAGGAKDPEGDEAF